MKTGQPKRLLAIGGFLILCFVLVCLSTSLQASRKRYEIKPEITAPQSQTDVARVIDAYERLMENYIKLTETNLTNLQTDVNSVTKKLDSIDQKISALSAQLETIQNKLKIEQLKKPIKPSVDTNTSPGTKKKDLTNP